MEIEIRTMQCITATVIVFSCLVSQNLAQVQQQECMDKLQPCLNYLNSKSNPPDSCCRPLEHVIRSMPECLCSLMTIEGSNQAQQAGINVTEAQTLPGRCGQHINPLGCVIGTPDTRSKNLVPNSVSSIRGPEGLSLAVVSMLLGLLAL